MQRAPVNDFQHVQLVVRLVHSEAEEQAGVPLVDDLQVPVLDEVAHLGLPQQDGGGELAADLLLLLGLLGLVPLLQPQLALAAEQDNEVDHGGLWLESNTQVGLMDESSSFHSILCKAQDINMAVWKIGNLYSQFFRCSTHAFSTGVLTGVKSPSS